VTPRASRDGLDGVGVLADGAEAAFLRVRALPDSGEANAALVALIARLLGRPKSAVTIVRGATQRLKQVAVRGDVAALAAAIMAWPRAG
jgi:uncharacterized protein YggU (UPF0235/DUF167 family)